MEHSQPRRHINEAVDLDRSFLERAMGPRREIFSHLHEGIWICNDRGDTVLVTPQITALLGFSEADLQGRAFCSLVRENCRPRATRLVDTCLAGEPVSEGLVLTRAGGGFAWVGVRAFPVLDDAGAIMGMVAAVLDHGERHDLMERLDRARGPASIGRLTGRIAHDLNNLLTIILGSADLIAMGKEGRSAKEFAVTVRETAAKAAALVQRLAAFGRRYTSSARRVDINQLLVSLRGSLDLAVGEDTVVALDLNPSPVEVEIDPLDAEQIVLNLAAGLRETVRAVGTVTVRTRNIHVDAQTCADRGVGVPGDYILLCVSAAEMGMDEGCFCRVFDPQFAAGGDGPPRAVGQYAVYETVKRYKGYVWSGGGPGGGRRFDVFLPRSASISRKPRKRSDKGSDRDRIATILLVEDDDALRGLTRVLLRGGGYGVVEAGNAAEALDLCGDPDPTPIDLLISDVEMPGMKGTILARTLAERRPGLKTLLMSGYSDYGEVQTGTSAKSEAFIAKPFTSSELLGKIREVLSGNGGPA